MKNNSFSFKKPKQGFLVLMTVFCALFANSAMAQFTFTWNGSTSSDWATAANWTKTGTTGSTSTYPGETTTGVATTNDIVVINNNSVAFAPVIATTVPNQILRLTINNANGSTAGATLTINSGATLNVSNAAVTIVVLNGGNLINNGTLNITSSAPGSNTFLTTGITCGSPTVAPASATEYGYSGTGALNINISAAVYSGSAAVAVTAVNANTTYKMLFDGATNISLTNALTFVNTAQGNAVQNTASYAFRLAGGTNASKLIVGGTGFTVGSVGSPIINGGLFSLGAQSNVTVNAGTTLTMNSASTNVTSQITSFSSSAVATTFTNKGTINLLGTSTRSGLGFSTGTQASPVLFNITNEGILNVNMTCTAVGSAPLLASNGGGTGGTGTAINVNNTATGTLTLKNNSATAGTGQAIFSVVAGETPPIIITNNGTLNLEGTSYTYGNKTTINNNNIINSNSEFRNFTAINNNSAGSINFVRTAATATTRQVVFNGVTATDTSGGIGSIYTDGTNQYVVVSQKFGSGTNLVANVLSSATVATSSGSLTRVTGTGTDPIAFTSVSLTPLNGALPSTTTNSGTVSTDTASNLNLIQGISAASAGTIAPGGASGKGIADYNSGSTLAINSILKLQVSGSAAAGVNYDQVTNGATGGGFDLTAATLDVTGIYTPAGFTVIDIVTTNATGTLTGTFASVIGLGSGWTVSYNSGTAGTVQLVYGTPSVPTITRLSSNGTNTITSACEGSTLIIIGTNLTGVSEITVDGVALTGVTDVSSTRAEGILPIGARVGTVAVTTPGGTVTTPGNLTVVENSTVVTAVTACDTYTWANNGQTYTTSGTYTGTTTSCVTQQLVLNIVVSPAPIVTNQTQCGGTYVWPSNGVTYSTSGTYNILVGCTAETLNLTITALTTTGSETVAACGTSYVWPVNGSTYTTAGTYTHVVGCNTATLTLTFSPATTTGSETVAACGSSYVWALNGQTYNASGSYTHVVGCNTATLALTLTPNTTTGSETVSECGSSYTWALNGQTYNASGSYTHVVGCNTATLTLTLTPNTTTGSETISQCGGTYTWPVNSVTYSASTTETVVSGCNTATLNLTITAPTTTGSVTQVQTGGTYTWAANSTTYSTSGIYTHVVGCNTATLDLTINPATSEIPGTFPAFCKGATIATATGATSLKFYAAATGGTALLGTTLLANAKTLWVTEVVNSLETTPRVSRLITVTNLPATPGAMMTTDAVLCKLIGTSNTVTYTVPVVVGAASYSWTLPPGVNAIGATNENAITVNFLGASTSTAVGGVGSIVARAITSTETGSCASAPRTLVLTSKLPTAPTSLTLTSEDTALDFDVLTVASSLSTLAKITKVGPYMGTSTVFILTAPVAPTAASYKWTLNGATQLSGGTSNIITVDFAGVPSGIGSLPITVQSVGGCGESTLRTLTLARVVPTAPTALVLTNTTQANLALPKITKVGPYTGTNIPFTLTATPVRVQGATATSYAWILPSGVNCTSTNTPTTVKVKSTVNTGTVEVPFYAIEDVPAISTASNVITLNFSGATGTGNLELKVFGVNGAGNSIARKLVLARALPTAPTALVLRDGAITVTKVGPYTGKTTALSLTATPFLTQGAEATSLLWTLPAGVNVTNGATLVSNNGLTKTWTSTATALPTVLTVDFAGVAPGVLSMALSVQAVNGAGTSATTRTLTVTAAAPTTPGVITTPSLAIPTFNPACSGTTTITVQVANVFGVDYTWTVGAGASVVSGQGTNSVVIDVENVLSTTLSISVVGSNGTGSSLARTLIIKKVATCREAAAIADEFNVIAYPNPSSSEFTIETSRKAATSVQVYDMAGRLIENRKENAKSVQVGARYATGAYNVIVTQGANTKTVRVVKK